jgi:SHS2 domain-containing protein
MHEVTGEAGQSEGARPVAGFDIIDHTADVGVSATGAGLDELFAQAALGMFSIIGDPSQVSATEVREVRAEADDVELLLAGFLSELLYLFEVEHFMVGRVDVQDISETAVRAKAHGEAASQKHRLTTEIKAVTHHNLAVERQNDGWHASVLFDI